MVSPAQLPEIRTELFVDGDIRGADDALQVVDPADGSLVGYAAAASAKQAQDAVAAAHRAFPVWAARSPRERAALLTAALAPLEADRPATAEVLTRENGKIRIESFVDSLVFAHRFDLATALADQVDAVTHLPAPPYRTEVGHLPLGVVTIIVPFNWPLAILAAALPQALLAGNTVVVKPPPTAPLATARTVALVAQALPPGVLNVVTGADAELGEALIQDDRVKKVCFTGSPGGGKRIMAMAAESLTRVALELGGNDPALVLADADLGPEAVQRLFSGTFDSTGQICMATKRLYVHRSRYDEVVDGLSAILAGVRLGHGLDEGVTMGPLHSARQMDHVQELTAQARAAGTEVREFGEPAEGADLDRGNFLRPSLVLDPADDRAWSSRSSSARPCRSCPSTTRTTRWPGPTTRGRACARRSGLRISTTPPRSPAGCAPATPSSTPTAPRTSTSGPRSAASTTAEWAARWGWRVSASSWTPTPSACPPDIHSRTRAVPRAGPGRRVPMSRPHQPTAHASVRHYPLNAWYAAAWDHEVGRNLLAKTVAGRPIVFYRTTADRAVALADACWHRLAPLSMGKLRGDDEIMCGYHGICYDADGRATFMPAQDTINPSATVHSYPVVERHRYVWVWPGDPALADPDLVPDLFWNDHPDWAADGKTIHVNCSYQLIVDNLMDLTHEQFVHGGSIGHEALSDSDFEVTHTDRTVTVTKWMLGIDPPPVWKQALNDRFPDYDGPVTGGRSSSTPRRRRSRST